LRGKTAKISATRGKDCRYTPISYPSYHIYGRPSHRRHKDLIINHDPPTSIKSPRSQRNLAILTNNHQYANPNSPPLLLQLPRRIQSTFRNPTIKSSFVCRNDNYITYNTTSFSFTTTYHHHIHKTTCWSNSYCVDLFTFTQTKSISGHITWSW